MKSRCDAGLAAVADAELLAHRAARRRRRRRGRRRAPCDAAPSATRSSCASTASPWSSKRTQPPAEVQRDRPGSASAWRRSAASTNFCETRCGSSAALQEPVVRRDQLLRLARRRQAEARQLVAREAREVGDVGREVGRQAERADLVGEAEAPEVLHRARLASRWPAALTRGAGLVVDEHGRDAAPAELVGEHQAARSAADDDHGDALGQVGPARIGRGHRRRIARRRARRAGYSSDSGTNGVSSHCLKRSQRRRVGLGRQHRSPSSPSLLNHSTPEPSFFRRTR